MNNKQPFQSAGSSTLFDYLIVIAKWKKIVAVVTVSCVAIAAIVSFLMPSIYMAETRILPAESDSLTLQTQLLSQLGDMNLLAGLGGKKGNGDLYAGLLHSRTVLDRVIDRFELRDVYGVKYRADARKRLIKALRVEADRKSGILMISVEDRDPKRASDLTNAFVDELKRITQEIAVTDAAQRRLFYEERLKDIKETLIRAEEAMKGYQERTGAIEMKEQAKAIIESVAKLRAQIASTEVHLKVLRTYATPQNPDLQRFEEELKGLKEQLAKMEAKGGNDPDPLMPVGTLPQTGTGYVRKMRDLKYNEALFELLTKQYEIAKMEESRNSAIQVVDRAVPPEKRVRPKRITWAAVAGLLGVFCGIMTAFALEKKDRLFDNADITAKIAELKRHIDFRRKR